MSDILLTAIGAIALYLFAGLRVLREYERGVYFLLGHLRPTKGPGLIFLPPLLAKMQKVSLRVMAIDIPPQDVITRDNISIKVNAVLYMRVKTPDKAVVGVEVPSLKLVAMVKVALKLEAGVKATAASAALRSANVPLAVHVPVPAVKLDVTEPNVPVVSAPAAGFDRTSAKVSFSS